jgi:5-methyltetrahydrofolate--homocysteine methyltransferase
MQAPDGGLIVIGENFNATRKIRMNSPRVVVDGGSVGIAYTDLDGAPRVLDVTSSIPSDESRRKSFAIPHIAEACRRKDLAYVRWAIRSQELAGAHVIDLCVDEMSPDPAERAQWMQWLVRTAQECTGAALAIDSSDPSTIRAGLDACDPARSRPAINSFNLEPGRLGLVALAKERNAMLFANASGEGGMPTNAAERVANLVRCMERMDEAGLAVEDRFLDPLVYPMGAGPEFGNHYLEAVRELRARYPSVHIFGGHSNVSFGMPNRKLLNHVFACLSIGAGCDTVMIDPLMNPPAELDAFHFASRALTARDEYAGEFIRYSRARSAAGKG